MWNRVLRIVWNRVLRIVRVLGCTPTQCAYAPREGLNLDASLSTQCKIESSELLGGGTNLRVMLGVNLNSKCTT